MKKFNLTLLLYLGVLLLPFVSCKKELSKSVQVKGVSDGIPTPAFNWETVNWMPTPPGQSQISPPWIGQGSIASVYGLDVSSDIKQIDGWNLIYNTFDPNAPGPLTNPYFMLYNKFRGLLRIYFYLNTNVNNGNQIVDGIYLVNTSQNSVNSTMLNFLGNAVVDPTTTQSSYMQLEAHPMDGSAPYGTNKWYMMQYEIAYDPNITSAVSYNNLQLSWHNNVNSITYYSFGGAYQGNINGTIGAPASTLTPALQGAAKTGVTAGLALIGSSVLNNASGSFPGAQPTYNSDGGVSGYTNITTNNNLGLPDALFTSIKTGLSSALSAATGNIPGAIANIFSAIIGGSTPSQTVPLTLGGTLQLSGNSTQPLPFPSSPTTVYVPGTNISNSARNYLPNYTNTLGVFNLTGKPTVNVHTTTSTVLVNEGGQNIPYTQYTNNYTVNTASVNAVFKPNGQVINSNPNGATITNTTYQVVLINPTTIYKFQVYGKQEALGNNNAYTGSNVITQYTLEHGSQPSAVAAVRVIFNVVPNNGQGKTATIIKTFFANIVPN